MDLVADLLTPYLRAIEAKDADALAALLDDAIEQHEYPNRFAPAGGVRSKADMLEGLARGAQVLSAERYEIREALTADDRVVLRLGWTGTLAVPLADKQPGDTLTAELALFFTVADGRITRIYNYDCVAPF